MTSVLVAGTFDFFHKGHQEFLTQAKHLGDTLSVIIARDENVHHIKGFFPNQTAEERKHNIEQFDPEISVFIGKRNNFLSLPKQINPDIIALGYDQQVPKKFYTEFSDTKIVRMKAFHPDKFKSSFFRNPK